MTRRAGKATTCCDIHDDLRMDDPSADHLATQFKALAHPVRIQMLHILSRYGGRVCVCDLEGQFDLAQPTISHHLKLLRTAGLIDCTRRGQWYYYRVDAEAVAALFQTFSTSVPAAQAHTRSLEIPSA
jgi:ArsR family transcriptional regulator